MKLPNNPVVHRRLEGLAIFLTGLYLYHLGGHSWGFFALLFFVPDAGAIGYLKGPRLGGIMYNLTHWFVWPIILGLVWMKTGDTTLKAVALIWGIHIAFDRMLGWGLKTEEGFYHTDMGLKPRIGRKS